jgi:phage FluMu protein Com
MNDYINIECSECRKILNVATPLGYLKLKEENEKLKAENEQYAHAFVIKDNDKYIFDTMKERADYYQAMLYLEGKVKELKAENAQLKAQLQNCDKVSHDIFNNHNMMPDHAREIGEIVGETERKPHVCTVCDGRGKAMDNNISIGIHCILDTNLFLDDAGNCWVRCGTCNGTGIVWEGK